MFLMLSDYMDEYGELLLNQNKDSLVRLLLDYSEKYPELKYDICAELGALDEKEEIVELKHEIREVVCSNNQYGYVGWRECDRIMSSLDDIINKCKKRMTQGYYVMAYSVVINIIEQVGKLVDIADSSTGSLTMTMDFALETLIDIAQMVNQTMDEEEKKTMYNLIIRTSKKKVFDDGYTDKYKVLHTALPLVTQKNAGKLIKTSKEFVEKSSGEFMRSIL